jgi:adenine-specific DNA-methyltransferase
MSTTPFSPLSQKLTSSLSKDEKKDGGIFFTPPSCIQRIMTLLRGVSLSTHSPFASILEPSCGSGEFLSALMREYPSANITGIELHPVIYEGVLKHFAALGGGGGRKVQIQHGDFLKYRTATGTAPPDLIIGNPPYFVMKKEDVAAEYYPFFDGRPNIFILFIIKSAQLLSAGGVLCFVLPSSFMNSQYYDKARKYIVRHFEILHMVNCGGDDDDGDDGGYLDTQQGTFILILRKSGGAGVESLACGASGAGVFEKPGVFEYAGATIFTDNLPRLTSLYAGSTSLHELGFKVCIGTVVWNQCKSILTNDATKTRLVYSSNVQGGKFVHKTYKNGEKKAFIDKPGIRTPMIVVNRGYGVGKYKFYYCLLTPDAVSSSSAGYLIENHLICITHDDSSTNDVPSSLAAFHRVIRSFNDPRTQEFISCYCGNSAISSTELHMMLPIYGS